MLLYSIMQPAFLKGSSLCFWVYLEVTLFLCIRFIWAGGHREGNDDFILGPRGGLFLENCLFLLPEQQQALSGADSGMTIKMIVSEKTQWQILIVILKTKV